MIETSNEIAADPRISVPCIDALDWLKYAQNEQLRLCDSLEEIADSLPNEVNKQKCIFAARSLGPLIKGSHEYEENVLFPWLEKKLTDYKNLKDTLTRLKFEHFEDECFAEELIDTLMGIGATGKDPNPEATGYMLRGFFEGMRRHIAFEREHLLNLVDRQAVKTAEHA